MSAFVWRQLGDDEEPDADAYEEALAKILGPFPEYVYDGSKDVIVGGEDSLVPVHQFPSDLAEAVVAVTIFLELPVDLGIPSDRCFSLIEKRDDRFGSWPADVQEQIAGIGSEDPNAGPINRLVIRRAPVRGRLPIVAADRAFGEWLAPFMTSSAFQDRQAMIGEYEQQGLPRVVTVVAFTQWFDVELWPLDESSRMLFLEEHLDAAIEWINRLIVAVAVTATKPSLRPLTTGDFASAAPFLAVAISASGTAVGTTDLVAVNDLPFAGADLVTAEELIAAHQLNTRMTRGDTAFTTFFVAFVQAMNSFHSHQWTDTVVNTSTAVEVFIYTVVREILSARGEDPEKIEQVTAGAFRNVREHHFVAGFRHDHDEVRIATERWVSGGYQVRCACIHKGQRATPSEATSAYFDAANLFGVTCAALKNDGFAAIVDDFGLQFEAS